MKVSPLTVVKVGGSLLETAEDLSRVGNAVAARRASGERLLVVVSALQGVTDRLEQACQQVLDPRSGGELVREVMDSLKNQHEQAMGELADAETLRFRIQPVLDGVERLLTGIRLTGEVTERIHDLVLAHGERLSAPLVAAAIKTAGSDARDVTSEEVGIKARGPFGLGSCDLEATEEGLESIHHELHDRVLVLTGFYGVNRDGDIVLFGRGGTDYTAGMVAAGLDAASLELWKNVAGFLSADPLAVKDARHVEELSYDEACELGYYGARILHPRCLDPLREREISVSVRSIEAAEEMGTRLVPERTGDLSRVAALAVRHGVGVVRVQGAAMVNEPGVAGAIFKAVGDAGINIDVVATAMTSVSFTVSDEEVPLALRTLRLMQEEGVTGMEKIDVFRDAALVGVVGDGLSGDMGIASRIMERLAHEGVGVYLFSHGPGDVSLNCVVSKEDAALATQALHETFFATVQVGDEENGRGGESGGRAVTD